MANDLFYFIKLFKISNYKNLPPLTNIMHELLASYVCILPILGMNRLKMEFKLKEKERTLSCF